MPKTLPRSSKSIETLADENNATGMTGNTDENGEVDDDRSIVQLFLDQIEFANVIIVSKAALVLRNIGEEEGKRRLQTIEKLLNKLNSKARVVVPSEDKYGDLDTGSNLINTGLFRMEEAQTSEAWIKELATKHVPETEEYGISSVVFEATDRPFHPGRLDAMIKGYGRGYLSDTSKTQPKTEPRFNRSKACCASKVRCGSRSELVSLNLHTAGRTLSLEPQGMPFLHCIPEED